MSAPARGVGLRRRSLGRVWPTVAVCSAVLALVATLAVWPAGAAASPGARSAPLPTTWTSTQGSWAIVPMGELDHPNDTFWQLFFRPAGATRWSLVTPPGVADNGGLVAYDGSAASLTAGFEPTQLLTYSPVAQTSDDGRQWSPGVLPAGLLAVPDAVATEADGSVLALVRSAGGSLLHSTGSLSTWTTMTSRKALAATSAGRACGVSALDALSLVAGVTELGVACSEPGVVGILTDQGGSWRPGGTMLSGTAGSHPASVLRLQSGASGTVGLVESGHGSGATLFAMWRSSSTASWSLSPALPLGGRLVTTGFGLSTAMVVVTAGIGGVEHVETIAGPGSAWTSSPAAPRGTEAVVVGPGNALDALAVASRDLTDWHLDAAGSAWSRTQTVTVPIQYGSST